MKTLEKLQAAIDELAAICKKHGVVLVGTCAKEGIYGEISIFDAHRPNVLPSGPETESWKTVDQIEPNELTLEPSGLYSDIPCVEAIGEWYPSPF